MLACLHSFVPSILVKALERERVRNEDPESVAFFNSRKMMTQTQRANKTGTQHAMAKKRAMQR